jgi:hypothetical protein
MALFLVVGPDAADVPFPLGFGALGFLAGVTFSGVLGLVEGRRRFDELSLPRFAVWGGVGGLLFSGAFSVLASLGVDTFLVLGPVFSLAGAGSAAGSLALARMGGGGTALPPEYDLSELDLPDSAGAQSLGPAPLRPQGRRDGE